MMPEFLNQPQTFRFDEMAILVNDKIDDPSKSDVDRYVGLEHIDSDSFKIRRWGVPTDVESSKLIFKSGDIIFGKRRVYQRKLAIADFDGICSAHAMVLRANTATISPQFLPFFMQSNIFMERALEISVGSLSPTINWKTLAKEEFTIPSKQDQVRILEVLQVMENSIQKFLNTVHTLNILPSAVLKEVLPLSEHEPPTDWVWQKLGDVIIEKDKSTVKVKDSLSEGQYPFFTSGTNVHRFNQSMVEGNNIFVSTGGIANFNHYEGRAAYSTDTYCITTKEGYDSTYLYNVLTSKIKEIDSNMFQGSGLRHLDKKQFKALPIPFPILETQKRIANNLNSINLSAMSINQKIEDIKLLKKLFMGEILSK